MTLPPSAQWRTQAIHLHSQSSCLQDVQPLALRTFALDVVDDKISRLMAIYLLREDTPLRCVLVNVVSRAQGLRGARK